MRGPRRARVRAGILVGCVVVLAVVVLATVLPGAGALAQPATLTLPVKIVPDAITPKSPGPRSTVRISGTVANTGDVPLHEVAIRLRWSGAAFVSRGELEEYSEGRLTLTQPLYATTTSVAHTLPPGGSARWAVKVRTSDLDLRSFGVYPLAVEAVAGARQVGLVRTYLPYVPRRGRPEPTRVAFLWPIVGRPHRSVGDTFVDDGLSTALGPDGRLGRLVASGSASPVPLTWVVDPMLLQDAEAMTRGYNVADADGHASKHHKPSRTARQWLDALRRGTTGDEMVPLPYADPDIMAVHRVGLDKDLTFAITKGPNITQNALRRAVSSDVAWPPDGWIDQDALDSLAVAGVRTVIVNDQAFPPAQPLTFTPSAVAKTPTVGGTVRVLLTDHVLTRILGRRTSTTGEAVLARQRFLAETALITDELPNRSRAILVAPPRRWNPRSGFASALLRAAAGVPWLRPVRLATLESAGSTPVSRAGLRYPRSARAHELRPRYLRHVRAMGARVDSFMSILTPRSPTFEFAVLRTESSTWRAHPYEGRKLRRAVAHILDGERGRVRILTHGSLLLASSNGTVPITISNDLANQTATVRLDVTPRNRARLNIGQYPATVRIGPQHKATVKVPISAVAAGVAHVTLRLMTPNGKPYGPPVDVQVRATGYGTTALVITGVAVAVLFLAVGVRLARRAFAGAGGRSRTENGDESEEREARREHAGDS